MELKSYYLQRAVEQMSTLPGIGKKTALRLVLQLQRRTKEEINAFAGALLEMSEHLKSCNFCGNISDNETCEICRNTSREKNIICVVEDIRDVMAIEATSTFKGVYHVLGGIISPMDGVGPSDLNIASLIEKVSSGEIAEIIFALSPTMEGDTTAYYLHKKLLSFPSRITTITRGVSVGTELQYADELSLGRSILYRQPFVTTE
jgi:recombination protein RecR